MGTSSHSGFAITTTHYLFNRQNDLGPYGYLWNMATEKYRFTMTNNKIKSKGVWFFEIYVYEYG